jgi:predicted unusual protein kinase regulating ubiquinone biosynthesis (AarF/ABC1/UbiB family)
MPLNSKIYPPKGYLFQKKVITGDNAVIVQLWNLKKKKSTYVQKFIAVEGPRSESRMDFWNEVQAQQKFAEVSLAPRVISADIITPELACITMKRITGTLENLLQQNIPNSLLDAIVAEIFVMLQVMCKRQLVHGDMHWGNIGYIECRSGRIKLQFIDFGFSDYGLCDPSLEIAAMLRGIDTQFMSRMTPRIQKRLILNFYKEVGVFQAYARTQGRSIPSVDVNATRRQRDRAFSQLHKQNMERQSQKNSRTQRA